MTDDTTQHEAMRELAHRVSDGIDIKLLWSNTDDRLAVLVCDTKTGDTFELDAPRDQALDVFHHPYAHAALQHVAYGSERAGQAFSEPYAVLPPSL